MAIKHMLQPWTTFGCRQVEQELTQPREAWIPTNDCKRAVITLDVANLTYTGTACTLHIETAIDPEGSSGWNTLISTASTGNQYIIAEAKNGASYPLQYWVRWRVDGREATAWETCFRSSVVVKK